MNLTELRVMVVEDHDFQRALLVRVLAGIGVTPVMTAANGTAALALLAAPGTQADVIITDLDMPGMDGMEFMRHLGKSRTTASIVLVSALDSALVASVENMARAYGLRILGVMAKPIAPSHLETLIRRHQPTQSAAPAPSPAGIAFSREEILAGLENDEFEPFFQPKVDLATGRVTGAEALARWCHPRKGVVAPHAFIGVLEKNGLIEGLTWTMLRKSAAFCREWRSESRLDLSVSVNISVTLLGDVLLADYVTALIQGERLDTRHVVLEVTESATSSEVGHALENLSRLRMKGFGLSIDDYGTGYSSMQQLTRIAFTELKIDQSFVTNATRQKAARVILESSLDMARKLHITSVAEGVETRQDWDLLVELGCHLAQGYWIARPMPAEALRKWTWDRTLAD